MTASKSRTMSKLKQAEETLSPHQTNAMLIKRNIQMGVTVAMAFLILVVSVEWWHAQKTEENFHRLDLSRQVIDGFQGMLVAMLDVEASCRGFALSGDKKYLETCQTALGQAQKAFAEAQQLSRHNVEEQRRLEVLAPLVESFIASGNGVMDLSRRGDGAGARQLAASASMEQTLYSIRALIGEGINAENVLLQQRAIKAKALTRLFMEMVLLLAGLLTIGLNLLASFITRRDFERHREAEAELARFFAVGQDMYCIAYAYGYFKRVNSAFTEVLGWSQEEMLSRPFLAFIHPDDIEPTLREVKQETSDGKKAVDFVNRYRHKDGSWRTLSWKSVPQPGGLLYATARDITGQQ